jgi:exodeoxyribonuclease V beta subunit
MSVPVHRQVRRGVPTWIEASAGTGKTWTLERIVVDRVREGASIESILVVTFTDKATREMRTRIRATLEDARDESKDREETSRLDDALLAFDRATISTLHGFCRRTLREHAFLSGRALEEQHDGSRALFGVVFRRWLDTELERRGPLLGLVHACLDWLEVDGLEALCMRLLTEHTVLEPAFDQGALDVALARLPSGAALDAVIPDLEDVAGKHPAARVRVGAVLRALDVARHARVDEGERLRALLKWGGSCPGFYDAEQANAAWLAHRMSKHVLGAPLRTIARAVATPLPALVASILPALRALLVRDKQRASIVDFDDLISGMADALRGEDGAPLTAALRDRYRHVVVDEFQDTDPLQWEILSRLFADCAPDRTLVLIGDPKQAIYGFRGADVHTYRRARDQVVARGVSTRLDTSFRATPQLLDALHAVILPDDDAPFFARADTYPAPVLPGNLARAVFAETSAGRVPLAPLTVLAVRGDPPLRLRPARRGVARALADEVRRLLIDDVRVTDGANERRLSASDIFVLTRSQAEGLEVAEALGRAGVPYAFFKQDGLFATAEARDLSDLLSSLVAPDDVARRARALATPFFAVTPEDFPRIENLPYGHPLLERFRGLASIAERGDVAALLSSILSRTGITRRELYLFSSERRLTNYLHLCEVLTSLAIEHRCGAQELAARLAALIEDQANAGSEEDVQRIESERAAVQLLTMHKSKGLEAEVVFVYGGLGTPNRGRTERRVGTRDAERVGWMLPRADGTSDPALELSIDAEEREESERLLYVAMTRARSLLYLPMFLAEVGPGGVSAGRIKGPYRVVHERLLALHRRGALTGPLFRVEEVDPGKGRARRAPRSSLLAPPTPAALGGGDTDVGASHARFEALRRAGGVGVVTSYSRMKSERDRIEGSSAELDAIARYHEIDEPSDASGTSTPSDADPGGPAFGVAVHRALELIDVEVVRSASSAETLADREEVAKLYRDMLDESGVSRAAQPLLARLVFDALRTPVWLGDHAIEDLARPSRRSPEVPFFVPLPEASHPPVGARMAVHRAALEVRRGFLRGVIDLLFEHRGKLYLVDWKTDRLEAYDEPSLRRHVDTSYLIQVRLYALALLRMVDGDHERFGGLVYLFMRGLRGPGIGAVGPLFSEPGTYFVRPAAAELTAWDQELRRSDAPFGYPLGLPRDGLPRDGLPRDGATS